MSTKLKGFSKISQAQLDELSTSGSFTAEGVVKQLTDDTILFTEDRDSELIKAELNGDVTTLKLIYKINGSENTSNTLSFTNIVYNSIDGSEIGHNTNLLVDWGDGTIKDYSDVGSDGAIEHSYLEEGIYTIKLYNCEYFPCIYGDSANFEIYNVELSRRTKAIDNNAFHLMYNFNKIIVPKDVYYIGGNAFVPMDGGVLSPLEVIFDALDFSTLILGTEVFPSSGCKIIVNYNQLEDAKTALPDYATMVDAYVLASSISENYALKSELTKVERWW